MLKQKLNILDKDTLSTQMHLVSLLLNTSNQNKGLNEFKSILNNDFLDFLNQASTTQANSLIKLQTIEKKLEIISSYPDIFTKNIIAVGGGFSAGKSEFISSFINDDEVKLPIGIEPTTAIPTYVINKDEPMILACNNQSASINLNEIDSNMYKKLSHKFINSFGFNLKQIMPYMVLGTKLKFDNICFIDTPGYNPSSFASDYTSEDLNTAKDYLKNASALIWLIGLDANGTIPKSDLDFLDELDLDDKELYIVLNKADLKTKSDIAKIMSNVASVLDEYGLNYSGISAYSSLQKLEIAYDKMSLDEFLARLNKEQISVKESIYKELRAIKAEFDNAIIDEMNAKDRLYKSFDFISDELFNNTKAKEHLEKLEQFIIKASDKRLQNTLNNTFAKFENSFKAFFGDEISYKYKPTTKEELKKLANDESINLANIDTSLITDMSYLFAESKRKDFSGINAWDTSKVTDMGYMFYKCENFNDELSFDTSNVTNMRYMFSGCINFNKEINFDTTNATLHGLLFGCTNYKQEIKIHTKEKILSIYKPKTLEELKSLVSNNNMDLGEIDTSLITDMSELFYESNRNNFSGINTWDTSKVTDMRCMFYGCKNFNEELSFDTSKVINMGGMFNSCGNFNQPLNFNTSNVTDMRVMFSNCSKFNQPLNFDTRNVTNMGGMFYNCPKFNQPLNFDTRNVIDMGVMFSGCTNFSQPLNFDTSKVTNMNGMFNSCGNFNQPLNFDTSKVIDMAGMFYKCSKFNQPLDFDTSSVTNMHSMFSGCINFNQLLNFDTSNTTDMSGMFSICSKFNQPLNFDTRNVANMGGMFYNCPKFNQPLNFDTSSVTTMQGMFCDCTSFNQPLKFDTSNVVNMSGMFESCSNFNQILHFDTRNVTDMEVMFYNCTNFNQTLNFDTSSVANMFGMFSHCHKFNQPLNFDTSNVVNMSGMFDCCSNFNQTLNFDTSSVTNMSGMFCNCPKFNQPLDFDTSSVTNMNRMFASCINFNQPLGFDTRNVIDMSYMFLGCISFNQTLDFDTRNVTNIDGMFYKSNGKLV